MKFDSNRAWTDAMAAVRANREVLLALGGVFFLLPTLLSTVFLTDVQTRIMATMAQPEVLKQVMRENLGMMLAFGVGGGVAQMIGYLAVTSLISDRQRPTVGESIRAGLRALPSLFAVAVIVFLGVMLATVAITMLVAGLFALIGAPRAGSMVAVVLLMMALAYAAIKLSLVVPVIVNEGVRNPVGAMARSWRLTRRNSARLFGFYLLLTLGYFVLAITLTLVLAGPVMLLLGQGGFALMIMGVVSGAISAAASVVLAAVVAQTHRQLAGPTPEFAASPFE
ncbi:glycerophosphoryl diester phosphodiesterase membrane domain-containing protein [Novosphingobium soli]|uniref:Glycerophosphoryl diester phosphodiesterase membrane domain-containing protein n=1 Tax=Novosphingobium soli TaxID=574956 RepID=A0ABV6CZ24_9SPHN